MVQNLTGATINAQLSGTITTTFPNSTVDTSFSLFHQSGLVNGDGVNQANGYLTQNGKISASGSATITLASLVDVFGYTVAPEKVRAVYILNDSVTHSSSAQITVGYNGGAGGLAPWWGENTQTQTIPAGDVFLVTNMRTGWSVTNLVLTLTNDDAQNGAWYKFLVLYDKTAYSSSSSSSLSSASSDKSSSSSSLSSASSSSSQSSSSMSSVITETDMVLLLHMDGTDTSTSFPDHSNSNHTVTANANAQVDTDQSVFGGASGLFDGTGDYLSVPDSSDWSFGSGAFTMDCRIRPTNASGDQMIAAHGSDSNNRWFLQLFAGNMYFVVRESASSVVVISGSATISDNTWYHVAVSRSGNDFKMFVNGTQDGSTATWAGTITDHAASLGIGSDRTVAGLTGDYAGHIDEFRILKGKAEYTSNFTPPTVAYRNPAVSSSSSSSSSALKSSSSSSVSSSSSSISGISSSSSSSVNSSSSSAITESQMVLLLHGDGTDASTTIEDSSNSHHQVTAVNSTQIDTAQKVYGTASILMAKATSDYASIPDSADWNFGAGDFVIDFRVRFATLPSSYPTACLFYSQYSDSSNNFEIYHVPGNTTWLILKSGGTDLARYSKAWVPVVDTWYHLAFVRDGTTIRFFIDGTDQSWTETTAIGASSVPNISGQVGIGRRVIGPLGTMDGRFDEYRILKGTNYGWTSNFTPPSAAYKNPLLSSSSSST